MGPENFTVNLSTSALETFWARRQSAESAIFKNENTKKIARLYIYYLIRTVRSQHESFDAKIVWNWRLRTNPPYWCMVTLRLSTYAVNWRFFLPSERKGLLGYYTVAWRYEFYIRVFSPRENKIHTSRHLVMFCLLYRQTDMDKIIGGNDRNYVIDKLTCEIMENKLLGSRMQFLWILRVVYFPVKHSFLYNKYGQRTLFLSQSIDSHRKLTVLSINGVSLLRRCP